VKAFLISIGLVVGAWALGAADGSTSVSYPDEYRKWVHVKSTLVGPQNPRFAANGGIHHFYANEKALEGYRTGKFPNGSVLIDDLLEIKEQGGVTSEGARRRVAVMVKDAARYRDTGGWGFEIFKGDESAPTLNAEGKAACFACHGKQTDRDSVFSQYRK
jgi:cytochrome P460